MSRVENDARQRIGRASRLERKAMRQSGTVKFFNTTKGFGFIKPDSGDRDVFVHVTALERAGMVGLREGEKVSFEVSEERGKQAVSVRPEDLIK